MIELQLQGTAGIKKYNNVDELKESLVRILSHTDDDWLSFKIRKVKIFVPEGTVREKILMVLKSSGTNMKVWDISESLPDVKRNSISRELSRMNNLGLVHCAKIDRVNVWSAL